MEEIIGILKKAIENNDHSAAKSRDIELLIRARTIEILKVQAESGIGFAMEAIAKIAASNPDQSASIQDSIDNLQKILEAKERQGT